MKRHVVCCSRPLVVMFPTVVAHAPDGGFSCFRHWVFVWPAFGGVGFHVPERWIFHVLGDGSRSLHVLTQYLTTNRLGT
jgi:hypothetical protein